MNATTGRAIEGVEHLRQSIADILMTSIGSRLERRPYGSLLPELIDHPDNGPTRVRFYAAVAGALMRWEPRIRVSRVLLESGPEQGQATLTVAGAYVPDAATETPLSVQLALYRGAMA